MRVAIQGQLGSFHDQAARQWFDDTIEIIPSETFSGVFTALLQHEADTAVVAIENSLYGGINQVYDLLESHHHPIVGEVHLPVHQQLIGDPHMAITHIYSHPVALAQCEQYLDAHYPLAQRIEHHDTAAAVEFIAKKGDPHYAAIASEQAAALYSLPIISRDIEDNPANFTRFLVVQPHGTPPETANRTSLVITTNHLPGALASVLGVFAARGINLSKLQSRPIVGKPWKYRFYLVVDAAGPILHTSLQEVAPYTTSVTVLGEYTHAL